MTVRVFVRCGLWGLLLAGLGGCTYPIAREYRLEARKDLTVLKVQDNPDEYKGLIVVWGGIILGTANDPNSTELTILRTPLDAVGYPAGRADAEARFLARTGQFLDPEIYHRGRRVTLAGEIAGVEKHPLGKTEYVYPVLTIKQIYLWRPQPAPEPYSVYPWYYDDWYGPGWSPYDRMYPEYRTYNRELEEHRSERELESPHRR